MASTKELAEIGEIELARKEPRYFEPLYKRYYEEVYRFVFFRIRNEAEVLDIVSQTFLNAMHGIKKYEHRGFKFSTWLIKISINLINQYYRKTGKDRFVALDLEKAGSFFELEYDQGKTDREWVLAEVLKKLEVHEMNLIQMRFFEERPFADIADILGLPEANVKMRVYRLLEKIRKEVSNVL